MDGHITGRIVAVHIIDQETDGVGHDVALQVDGVEVAEQDRLARHLALHVAGEGLHIRLEESDVGMVGIKLDIKRILGNVDTTVELAATAIRLGDVARHQDTLGLAVKLGADVQIAHHTVVIGNVLDEQARRVQSGIA